MGAAPARRTSVQLRKCRLCERERLAADEDGATLGLPALRGQGELLNTTLPPGPGHLCISAVTEVVKILRMNISTTRIDIIVWPYESARSDSSSLPRASAPAELVGACVHESWFTDTLVGRGVWTGSFATKPGALPIRLYNVVRKRTARRRRALRGASGRQGCSSWRSSSASVGVKPGLTARADSGFGSANATPVSVLARFDETRPTDAFIPKGVWLSPSAA